MNEEMKALMEKIEELGWRVDEEEDNEYRLAKFSPAGQDFSIVVEGEDAETLIDNIDKAYENYDVSTETYLWLDDAGHGKNGAPHELKDVLKDMEACEKMIKDLHHELTIFHRDYEERKGEE